MACRFCDRIKRLKKIDVLLIIFICVFMYVVNQFQMKQYREQKALEKAKEEQRAKEHLEQYEHLQRQCLFKSDKKACEALEAYE
ncbi:Uncharacterised protein [Helicobacter cinaedi]|uniref:Uncharacterized protein n=1 Tax=Helicobacter cinaedi TaxID=213 RepID=A0A377JTM2_9HELI|nr:hypothetical protein [Helicobacter cinaedi]STP10595.1 Uncharacterised protein [Helicobacter cinaedi]